MVSLGNLSDTSHTDRLPMLCPNTLPWGLNRHWVGEESPPSVVLWLWLFTIHRCSQGSVQLTSLAPGLEPMLVLTWSLVGISTFNIPEFLIFFIYWQRSFLHWTNRRRTVSLLGGLPQPILSSRLPSAPPCPACPQHA